MQSVSVRVIDTRRSFRARIGTPAMGWGWEADTLPTELLPPGRLHPCTTPCATVGAWEMVGEDGRVCRTPDSDTLHGSISPHPVMRSRLDRALALRVRTLRSLAVVLAQRLRVLLGPV